jgi:thiopurine S-methyltransferase
MSSRDNHLWLKLWRNRQIDFHQKTVNKFLARFWPGLDLIKGSRIFVPLCGKSLDMIWLAKQGYEVIGIELSPIAVKAFFRENHLQPVRRRMGKFTLWKHGRISILCGDFFLLNKLDLGHIDTVYDRAALTALPEDIRKTYVSQMRLILPGTANMFLLTIEDIEEKEGLKINPTVDQEIDMLYSQNFDISLTHTERVFEHDPQCPDQLPTRAQYKVYRISPLVNM